MNDPTRIEELELLMKLIMNCNNINNGSHVLEKLQENIEISDKLLTSDHINARRSFMSYLRFEFNKNV